MIKEGTEGILLCKIKSIMSEPLVDYVTRGDNQYLRLLRAAKIIFSMEHTKNAAALAYLFYANATALFLKC